MKKINLLIVFIFSMLITNAQLSWLRLPDYPGDGKVGCSSFSINGKGYMGLGFDNLLQGSTDWYEYDPVSNTWTQKTSFPSTGVWGSVNFVIGDKGYVVTGASNSGNSNKTWEYDPITDTWTAKANFPGSARQNAAGFSINGKGYVGTGYNGNSLGDFYVYDPVLDIWTPKTNFPGAVRGTAGGFSIGGKGYLGLGTGANSVVNYNDIYEYNPLNDSWAQKADFPITFIDAPTTYSSGTDGYVLCGYYYQNSGITHNPLNTLYSYDPVANEWALKGTFRGLPRGYASGFSLSNDLYICAGAQSNDANPNLILTDLWKLSNGLTLRVAETGNDIDLNLFPNPVINTINFNNVLSGYQFIEVRVFDITGKLIEKKKLKSGIESVDVSGLSKGIYFVELITSNNEILDSKFVKQ